jgi:autotransporter-associated beta strand protein
VADGKTLTFSGSVFGGRLILENSDAGSGVLILSGNNSSANDNLLGGVSILGGTLRLGNDKALNAYGLNTLTFGSATTQTLQINGARNITVAGLTSAATSAVVENGAAGAAQFNVYNGADNSYAGVLQDGAAGTLAFAKAGCGTLTLPSSHTYTGATTVQGGLLAVDGSLAAASLVTVQKGSLGGTGTVGPVTVLAGGKLAPGSSVGTLTTGSLTLNPGAVLDFELDTPAASDRVTVVGDMVLDGVLNVTPLVGFGGGQYTLLTYTGVLTDNGLDLGDVPDVGVVYSVKTSTPGSVFLSAAAPGTVLMIR